MLDLLRERMARWAFEAPGTLEGKYDILCGALTLSCANVKVYWHHV